jgi:hypothetical protein
MLAMLILVIFSLEITFYMTTSNRIHPEARLMPDQVGLETPPHFNVWQISSHPTSEGTTLPTGGTDMVPVPYLKREDQRGNTLFPPGQIT